MGVLRRHQQSFLPVRHDAAIARNVSGDDGSAGRHRFEEHDAEALSRSRGCAKELTAGVVARELFRRDKSDEVDIANAIALHHSIESVGLAATHYDQPGVGKLLL